MVGIEVIKVDAETKLERQLAFNYNKFRDMLIKGIEVISFQPNQVDQHFILSDGEDNIAVIFSANVHYAIKNKDKDDLDDLTEKDLSDVRISYGIDDVDDMIYSDNYGDENIVSKELMIRIYKELIRCENTGERMRFKFL